jgi:hypothetical protein
VELGVAVGPQAVRVGVHELVPAVAQPHQPGGAVGAAFHAGGERLGEAALDLELAVEISLEQPDVAVQRGAPERSLGRENQAERRRPVGVAVLAAVGKAHAEGDVGALADPLDEGPRPAGHGRILPS